MSRPITFNLRLAPEDVQRLQVLAAHYNVSRADVVRMLAKRDFDALDAADALPRSWDPQALRGIP